MDVRQGMFWEGPPRRLWTCDPRCRVWELVYSGNWNVNVMHMVWEVGHPGDCGLLIPDVDSERWSLYRV